MNYQRKSLKDIDFLVNALETVFFKCLNAVSVFVSEGQYCCKWICFLNVRIMSVIEVIVLFVESVTHTVLMILKKLNNNKQWCNLFLVACKKINAHDDFVLSHFLMLGMLYAYMQEYVHNDCFLKNKANLYNMFKVKIHKTSKSL